MRKLFLSLSLFASLFFCQSSNAQSLQPTVIASDGEYYTSSSGSVSWTLGEVITETYSAGNNILTQGFQQPKSGLVGVWNIKHTESSVFIYPNPTRGNVFIDMSKLPADEYTIELFDGIGKKIFSGVANAGGTAYPLWVGDQATGIYLLSISSSTFRQSYKIINNQ